MRLFILLWTMTVTLSINMHLIKEKHAERTEEAAACI
jgi:hypothetical protein